MHGLKVERVMYGFKTVQSVIGYCSSEHRFPFPLQTVVSCSLSTIGVEHACMHVSMYFYQAVELDNESPISGVFPSCCIGVTTHATRPYDEFVWQWETPTTTTNDIDYWFILHHTPIVPFYVQSIIIFYYG